MAKFCIFGAAGLFVACVVWYVIAIKPPKLVNLQKIGDERQAEQLKADRLAMPRDTVQLNKIGLADPIRRHLLDGSFTNVVRMQDLSEICNNSFYSSFLNASGTAPARSEIRIANVGQPAQFGDSLIADAPFRGLLLAGFGSATCFIYYQHGGRNYPSYCLAVIGYAVRKIVWVGEVRDKARTVRELRRLLIRHQFDDSDGGSC